MLFLAPVLVTLMMKALCSSETSVLTRATWCNIPEDGILHSHHSENLKSYKLYSVAKETDYPVWLINCHVTLLVPVHILLVTEICIHVSWSFQLPAEAFLDNQIHTVPNRSIWLPKPHCSYLNISPKLQDLGKLCKHIKLVSEYEYFQPVLKTKIVMNQNIFIKHIYPNITAHDSQSIMDQERSEMVTYKIMYQNLKMISWTDASHI
jgi:hypothetical protein